jgi:TorA maturation chaperone TorD
MVRCTAEERALGRATLYRALALAFSYPTAEVWDALAGVMPAARVAAELTDDATASAVADLGRALSDTDAAQLESNYQQVFTLSYSEDCPPYETAFSASHIFQQTQQQADIAGFYRAFGVDATAERGDHIALELEFCYLLALKEARARELGETGHIEVARAAQRSFARDHLLRWASIFGQRVVLTSHGSPYEAGGRLLIAFTEWDRRFLRLGTVKRYRDEPLLMADEPGEFTCPYEESAVDGPVDLPLFESAEEVHRAFTAPA